MQSSSAKCHPSVVPIEATCLPESSRSIERQQLWLSRKTGAGIHCLKFLGTHCTVSRDKELLCHVTAIDASVTHLNNFIYYLDEVSAP